MEKLAWLVLGGTTFVAALFAYRSRRALYVARGALGLLMIGAGALVNLIYLVTGSDYANFADAAHFGFIRDTWRSVVAPHQGLFIILLIVFEATVGLLILSGGRKTQLGLVGLIGMQLGLLVFGWVLTIWAVAMIPALLLVLRAQRHWSHDQPVRILAQARPPASRPLTRKRQYPGGAVAGPGAGVSRSHATPAARP
jgi:hypothetical protein